MPYSRYSACPFVMAPVTHIVLFRYRSDIPWTALEAHFRDFASLKDTCLKDGKPYLLSIQMGKNTSWENFGKGMTHAFIIQFQSEGDRDYYLIHDQVHRRFSEQAGPFIEDSVVVDLKDGVLFSEAVSSEKETAKVMQGSCHCCDIKYSVTLSEYQHVLCHCRTCQLLGGGPYSCNAIVAKEALRVREGKLSVYSYTGASGKPVLCYHCGNCTSHVYHHQMANPDKIVVRTLLLEGGDKMGVGGEIFAEGSLGWARSLKEALPS